jgi:hypothetical protein
LVSRVGIVSEAAIEDAIFPVNVKEVFFNGRIP